MVLNEDLKKMVAERAVSDFVKDGMTVGLGTGSTANYAIAAVGRLIAEGFNLKCVATSLKTERVAKEHGIAITSLDDVDYVDVTIDGADEVDNDLQLIKGLGGALLREKVVAAASVEKVTIVDESKFVDVLGVKTPLPVEVIPFGHKKTAYALGRQGCVPTLRIINGRVCVTDAGNYTYDCKFESIERPFFLEMALNNIPGVVNNGLFLNTATDVLIAHSDGSINRKIKA